MSMYVLLLYFLFTATVSPTEDQLWQLFTNNFTYLKGQRSGKEKKKLILKGSRKIILPLGLDLWTWVYNSSPKARDKTVEAL